MNEEGEYIRQLRRSRGWSADDLGRMANVSGTTVRLIELGRRGVGPKVRARIAEALGVSVADLLTRSGVIAGGEIEAETLRRAVQSLSLSELITMRYNVDKELADYLGSMIE